MSLTGTAITHSHQSAGTASTALVVHLMKTLVTNGTLTQEQAADIVQAAMSDLRHSDYSVARGAVDILREVAVPAFE
ncbi:MULTISPECIES: hypothetical protein [Methylorubrum]|uniref:hypothetical protein n=1 Tax=Methylorubrum TaxID=2282523 RepID=UPI0020A104D8|nr:MULTISPECIES: hypothetical protein [Methylorubrum]MCP1550691.1 polyhydroxyalkanoate synthesis regulator phasin [Methylorubrum zatmanii]MCP1552696.1 polyhydroxyalkanoate synthesis regulator phasin [Methylorubrum extorquens]MCP1580994.1 polyhydroxyalkanoate synthesis regulator phasin [Methylorubrum extorquens]